MSENFKTLDISVGTIFRIVVIGLILVLFFAIWKLLASVFLAVIVTASIEPTVRWLEKHHIHRFLSVIFLYLLSLAALFGIFYAILPSLFSEIRHLSLELPRKYDFLSQGFDGGSYESIGFLAPALGQLFSNFENQLGSLTPDLFTFVSSIFGGALSFVLVIIISFYLSLQRNGVERFLMSITPSNHREYVADFWTRVERRIGRWLQAQFVMGVFMGIGLFIILSLLGIKYALTIAILAGILEVLPIIGPIIVGIVMFLTISVESFVLALIAVGIYVLLQQLQQSLVIPTVMARVVGLNPVIILISVLVGAELAGIWGIILAMPIVAIMGEFFRDIQRS